MTSEIEEPMSRDIADQVEAQRQKQRRAYEAAQDDWRGEQEEEREEREK